MLLIVLFCVFFVCKCVLYYFQRVSIRWQLTKYINIVTKLLICLYTICS